MGYNHFNLQQRDKIYKQKDKKTNIFIRLLHPAPQVKCNHSCRIYVVLTHIWTDNTKKHSQFSPTHRYIQCSARRMSFPPHTHFIIIFFWSFCVTSHKLPEFSPQTVISVRYPNRLHKKNFTSKNISKTVSVRLFCDLNFAKFVGFLPFTNRKFYVNNFMGYLYTNIYAINTLKEGCF